MAKKTYDFVIVGGGLSGCLMAKALGQQNTSKIALIEASGQLGPSSGEMLFLPAGAATDRALDFIEGLTGHSLSRHNEELTPLTFEKGQLQPFIGFGEKVPPSIDELMPYLSSQRTEIEPALFDLLQVQNTVDVFTKSQVTKLEVTEARVSAAVINGDHRLEARTFILCSSPSELLKILPPEALDAKIAQKLNRAKLWTSVSLNLIHKKVVTTEPAMHIFLGGETSCCIGQFHSTAAGLAASQWMSFVTGEDFDEEQAGSALREMKRIIKRAYPTIFEDLLHERLVVRPNSHGTVALKFEEDFSVPGLDNLWLSSSLLRAEKNLVGSVLQVQRVASSIQRIENHAATSNTDTSKPDSTTNDD
jgi:hypothetical protein